MKYRKWKVDTLRRALEIEPLTVGRSGWLFRGRRIYPFQIAKYLIDKGEAVRRGNLLVRVVS